MDAPNVAQLEVVVPLEGQPLHVTTDDFNKAACRVGMATLTAENVNALRDVGIYVEQQGAILIAMGRAMATASKLDYWLDMLVDIANGASDDQIKLNCAQAAGMLIGRQITNQQNIFVAMELRGSYQNRAAAGRRSRSFMPGQPVEQPNITQFNVAQVNIGGSKEEPGVN